MRILITTNGENIFSEEERQDLLEKKFRSTTTNKRYLKKLTIEKFTSKYDTKKPQNTNLKVKIILFQQALHINLMISFQKQLAHFIQKL